MVAKILFPTRKEVRSKCGFSCASRIESASFRNAFAVTVVCLSHFASRLPFGFHLVDCGGFARCWLPTEPPATRRLRPTAPKRICSSVPRPATRFPHRFPRVGSSLRSKDQAPGESRIHWGQLPHGHAGNRKSRPP